MTLDGPQLSGVLPRGRRLRAAWAGAWVFGAWGAACGYNLENSSVTGLLDPSQTLDPNPVVTITQAGVSPPVLHVGSPASVEFKNQDRAPHTIADAPELGSGPCPEIQGLGALQGGQSLRITLKETLFICGYKDAAAPTNQAFQGLIAVH